MVITNAPVHSSPHTAEVDTFVKGMIRIQRLAGPIRKKVKNIHYRRNVAQEILKTEEYYVESLDVLLCVRKLHLPLF
jgi:hypothetical protein